MSTPQTRETPLHTPTPWRVSRSQSWGVETPTDDLIRCYGNGDANARFIVEAVNKFEELKNEKALLISALQDVVISCERGHAAQMKAEKNYSAHFSDALTQARAALNRLT